MAPSGLVPNTWIFTIRHVPLNPPGDLIMIVNPAARFIHCEGPVQLASLSPKEKATVITPLLLKAFNNGLGVEDGPRVSPWKWSSNDSDIAREVGLALKELGVKEELCVVSDATEKDKRVADEVWQDLFRTLTSSMGA